MKTAVTGVALALALAGCTTGSGSPEMWLSTASASAKATSPSTEPSTGPPPSEATTSSDPNQRLQAAIVRLMERPTGRLHHEVTFRDQHTSTSMVVDGAYDGAAGTGIARTVFPRVKGKRLLHAIYYDPDQLLVSMSGMKRCWLRISDEVARGSAFGDVGRGTVPVAVLAMDRAKGYGNVPGDPAVVLATIRYADALHAISPKLAKKWASRADGRVEVQVRIEDGVVAGWSLEGGDVLTPLAEADVDYSARFEDQMNGIEVDVRLSEVGEDPGIEAPRSRTVVTDAQAGKKSCRGTGVP